jgi:hypothetical protein
MDRLKYHRSYSANRDPEAALREVCALMPEGRPSLSIFFCSSGYDLEALAKLIPDFLPDPVVGCTSAGEIHAPDGYVKDGFALVSLYSPELKAYPRLVSGLARFDVNAAQTLAQGLRDEAAGGGVLKAESMFTFLMVDGMSMLEEQLVAMLFGNMDGVPLIGGSAGDGLRFGTTQVYFGGAFRSDAAVLVLVDTTLPFETFRIQHFEPTGKRLVISESDGSTRTVFEINGGPAAEEYARAVGIDLRELTPQVFAAYPVMLRIGGEYFVRSIQKANPDGSLTFFCAIDNGLVLTVAKGKNLVEHLGAELARIRGRVPGFQFVLGCDCILRRLELEQKGQIEAAGEVLKDYNFIGFSTYGEQYNGIHVNQTLTGVALGM